MWGQYERQRWLYVNRTYKECGVRERFEPTVRIAERAKCGVDMRDNRGYISTGRIRNVGSERGLTPLCELQRESEIWGRCERWWRQKIKAWFHKNVKFSTAGFTYGRKHLSCCLPDLKFSLKLVKLHIIWKWMYTPWNWMVIVDYSIPNSYFC